LRCSRGTAAEKKGVAALSGPPPKKLPLVWLLLLAWVVFAAVPLMTAQYLRPSNRSLQSILFGILATNAFLEIGLP